jgi:hypothetical protein
MPHYKSMFDDKDYLFAFDLQGRDVTVTIERVEAGTIIGEAGRKSKKPMVTFRGAKKKLAINKTNGRTIAQLYGNDTSAWIGKSITIYPTTTTFGNDTVECIRVRPTVPKQPTNGGKGAAKPTIPKSEDEARELLAAEQDSAQESSGDAEAEAS